jgi:hypothetical protein
LALGFDSFFRRFSLSPPGGGIRKLRGEKNKLKKKWPAKK